LKKEFGGKITKKIKVELSQSPNWKKKRFRNLVETKMEINLFNLPHLLSQQFLKINGRFPSQSLPVLKFDSTRFLNSNNTSNFIWYGHSTVLLNIHGTIIFIDPMMSFNASPVASFSVKRFSDDILDVLDELPTIDLLLFSHDHYDHLDFESIKKLIDKVKNYWVPLGVKRHLIKWNVSSEKIKEFDWWGQCIFNCIEFTFTPSRHSGGRRIIDKDKSLWGGWSIKSSKETFYFSGDGGYGHHFEEIGDKLGPFDFGFIECGQYNKLWSQIHMFPHEAVQAALDVKVKTVMPVHWAGFSLSLHHWKSPVKKFIKYAEERGCEWTVPALGDIVSLKDSDKRIRWWDKYD
tara:strand:+ start:168 stop:1211 length:1044 start_codon:yes stop_codon:yes gene_type:complete